MRTGIKEFNGERLQKALNVRLKSVSWLSEKADISSSMLYSLINNEKKPSYETLSAISSAINLPNSYFIKTVKHENTFPFFRKFNRATKQIRVKTEQEIEWIIEVRDFLSKYVKFPELNIPEFSIVKEKSPQYLKDSEIEKIAQKTREYWGLGGGVITNTTILLENNGFLITKFELGTGDIDALSKYELKKRSAYILLSTDKESPSRSKFDNAHELGHAILHRHLDPNNFDFKKNHTLLEKQANRFAGAFLLPETTFSRDFQYPTLESYKVLKSKWHVSIALLIYRSKQLELINERTYRNLQINISRRGWRTSEPLEDKIEEEKPTLFKQALDLILKEKVMTVSEVVNRIGLGQTDIERICGLRIGYLNKYKNEKEGPNLRLIK